MPPSDFIPDTDSGALDWMQTFAAALVGAPSLYMISVAEAAAINLAVQAYAAARADAIDPAQRSAVTVAIKDESRNAAEQLCRQYAGLIKLNAGISDADKIAIGVRPVNPSREPVFCPQTAPKINILAATFGIHTLEYCDSLDELSKKKPFGATEIQLFRAIDDEPVGDPEAAEFYGKFTKNPVPVAFAHADAGKVATYFSRWAGRRGDVGPWSIPVSLNIAA